MTTWTKTGTVQIDSRRYPARHNGRTMEWLASEDAGHDGWLPVRDNEIGATFRTDAELAQEERLAASWTEGTVKLGNGAIRQAWRRGDAVIYRTPANHTGVSTSGAFTPED